MKAQSLAVALAAFACLAGRPAFGGDVPYAQSLNPPSGQFRTEFLPTLGDIMGAVQGRHAKLWFAGRAANWPLALYEIQQIKDGFDRSALLYANIPVDEVARTGAPLQDLAAAAKARNGDAFAAAFGRLTDACNACHISGEVGFIRIQAPRTSPFANQSFAP